jgi:hypothetical protein
MVDILFHHWVLYQFINYTVFFNLPVIDEINVQIILPPVNYGVVLLLVVVSLMIGSTTCVPMSRGYGGDQTATQPSYCTTRTYAITRYYCAKAPE